VLATIQNVFSDCVSPISKWPQMATCSNNGDCINGSCVCYGGYIGRQDTADLSGFDCGTNIMARKVIFSISCATSGITALFAIVRLITLLPFKWPLTLKHRTCITLIGQYIAWIGVCLGILIGDLWITDSIGIWILFWLSCTCGIFTAYNKTQIFIKVAMAYELNSETAKKMLSMFCLMVATASSIIGAGFMLGNYFVKSPQIKDGMIIGYLICFALVNVVYVVIYIKFGREILMQLEKCMDQSPQVQEAIQRIRTIRNQAISGSLVTSTVLIIFVAIPYLRSQSTYVFGALFIFYSINVLAFVYELRKGHEDKGYHFGGTSTKRDSNLSVQDYNVNTQMQ